jgi:hypothetical protein
MPTSPVVHDLNLGAIETAVKETARGRAFLTEYARKVRQSDTLTMLALIGRLERWSENQDIRLAELEGRDTAFRNQRPEVHAGAAVGLLGTATGHTTGSGEVPFRSGHLDVPTATVCDQESVSVGQKSNDGGGIISIPQSRGAKDRIEDLANALRDRDRRIADLTHGAADQLPDEGLSALVAPVDDGMSLALPHSAASDAMGRFSPDTATKTPPREQDVLEGIARALGPGW